MEETQGVVGSAETGSPSRGTLASLREASTSPRRDRLSVFINFNCENTLSRCPLDSGRQNKSSMTERILFHLLGLGPLNSFHQIIR